ncbi:MAG: hypothetical protein ACK4E0_05690 [Chitinophagaceae bacterium]
MKLTTKASRHANTLRYFLTVAGLSVTVLFSCKKSSEEETPQLPDPVTCTSVTPSYGLSTDVTAGTIIYTAGDGTRIAIEPDRVIVSDPGYAGFSISYWGISSAGGQDMLVANHQNLNGKHMKDRNGARTSLIMADGVKITMAADGPGSTGALQWISIIDGNRAHLVNMKCKTVIFSGNSATAARALDDRDADGETSKVEITSTGLLWNNIYQEDTPGNKVENLVPIGELRKANPNQVNDYYDDPRLGHT